jgi:hypothetical protein
MFPTIEDFLDSYPRYNQYVSSVTAMSVFDFLSEVENINRMLTANNNGKNALFGVLNDLELNFKDNSDFNFMDGFVKQCVGTMVKFILYQFGYESHIQKDMPRGSYSFFTSAMSYKKTFEGKFRLIQKLSIEPIAN